MLRPADAATLVDLGLDHRVDTESGFTLVQVEDYPVGDGLTPSTTTLLLRLPPGFPDATPDMFWLDPPVTTAANAAIPGTDVRETHLGRTWQRWSRHIQGQWRPGVDNLATYLAYIRRCLDHARGRG
jgi:hypothetical protein